MHRAILDFSGTIPARPAVRGHTALSALQNRPVVMTVPRETHWLNTSMRDLTCSEQAAVMTLNTLKAWAQAVQYEAT